jgi:hypothetical protein
MAKGNRAKRRSGKGSAPASRSAVPAKLSVLKWWLAAFAVLVIVSAFGWALSAPRESGADEARAKGWTVVSMKDDWKRVFAFETK